jgi:hypothetical protein
MPIVLISESLLLRSSATDGRILRDRVLSGFGVRLNARKRTFLVATSISRGQPTSNFPPRAKAPVMSQANARRTLHSCVGFNLLISSATASSVGALASFGAFGATGIPDAGTVQGSSPPDGILKIKKSTQAKSLTIRKRTATCQLEHRHCPH